MARRRTPWTLWIVLALMVLIILGGYVWEAKYGHHPSKVAQPAK
jgi:hypothetical protein